jgi:peptidoglycan/LPS O-acetylase OafA/YrhL
MFEFLVSRLEDMRMPVIYRFDSIMFGVLGAFLLQKRGGALRRHGHLLLAVGIVLTILNNRAFFLPFPGWGAFAYNQLYVTLAAVGTLLAIPQLSEIKHGTGPVYRLITFISKVSYPMYLTNLGLVELTLIPWIRTSLNLPAQGGLAQCLVELAAYWVLTIGVSYLIHVWFEVPIMNLRDKLGRKSSAMQTRAAV